MAILEGKSDTRSQWDLSSQHVGLEFQENPCGITQVPPGFCKVAMHTWAAPVPRSVPPPCLRPRARPSPASPGGGCSSRGCRQVVIAASGEAGAACAAAGSHFDELSQPCLPHARPAARPPSRSPSPVPRGQYLLTVGHSGHGRVARQLVLVVVARGGLQLGGGIRWPAGWLQTAAAPLLPRTGRK